MRRFNGFYFAEQNMMQGRDIKKLPEGSFIVCQGQNFSVRIRYA